MYLSVRDRPGGSGGRRTPVAPVVVTLGLVSLLTDVSSEAVAAILPIYLTTALGMSTLAYGFVDGLYQGVSALVRIAGGWVADRTAKPKPVALTGYLLSALARVGLLLATGVGAISAVITADRIGKGLRTAPRDAMIAAATPASGLGRAFGVHRTLDTIGAALGPLLAFWILWVIPQGYRTVLVVSLAFAVLGVAMLWLLVPGDVVAERTEREPFAWSALTEPGLVRVYLVAGALGLLTIGDGFLYLALLDRDPFATAWFPMLYVGTNVGYLLLAIPFGVLADRIGRARVLVGGHLALALAYLCAAAPWTGLPAIVVTLALLGAFYAATDGVIAALASRLVAPAARASGIAGAQTVVALARLLAAFGFGALWYAVGPRAALVLVATVLLLAIPLAAWQLRRVDVVEVGR